MDGRQGPGRATVPPAQGEARTRGRAGFRNMHDRGRTGAEVTSAACLVRSRRSSGQWSYGAALGSRLGAVATLSRKRSSLWNALFEEDVPVPIV